MTSLLANTYRPVKLQDMVGQKHLLGSQGIITRMVQTQQLFSLIFFGLPGTGKSTLAQVICCETNTPFGCFNPTRDSKSDLMRLVQAGLADSKRYVLIIDEIHRMNRDKQDVLLPYLETNELIIFGTTTENPYFAVNPAIRSRCHLLELFALEPPELKTYLTKLSAKLNLKITAEALDLLVQHATGDVRMALNLVDLVQKLYASKTITAPLLKMILPRANLIGAASGSEFYDLLSAFHKSLRGSDADAAVHYLARLLKLGDLSALNRRLLAMAYEDVGLANPTLLPRVLHAICAAERVGLPEAQQIYATIVIELCLSPKSNSAHAAIQAALTDLDAGAGALEIPLHLRDGHYAAAANLGRTGYKWPHDYPNHWVAQQYLPRALVGTKYYHPQANPLETKMNQAFAQRKNHD